MVRSYFPRSSIAFLFSDRDLLPFGRELRASGSFLLWNLLAVPSSVAFPTLTWHSHLNWAMWLVLGWEWRSNFMTFSLLGDTGVPDHASAMQPCSCLALSNELLFHLYFWETLFNCTGSRTLNRIIGGVCCCCSGGSGGCCGCCGCGSSSSSS